jgi:hypothetical protein
MQLIETKTLGTASANIEFAAIPQNFTDLYIVASIRSAFADVSNDLRMSINGLTTNRSWRDLVGTGSSVATYSGTTTHVGNFNSNTATSNTFGNGSIYIANYTAAVNKSISFDTVSENNATLSIIRMGGSLWSSTAAITSLTFTDASAANLMTGSTISLYGIGGVGDGYAPKATGGSISYSNGYWVHEFASSGTFTPTASIASAEYLVIAGGGAGSGSRAGGGGGAGGFRTSSAALTSGTNYTVTVGAGASGVSGGAGANGNLSSFNSLEAAGGGGGGVLNGPGSTGGSGGGGGASQGGVVNAGGAGNTPSTSPSQGNAGGGGTTTWGRGGGGGGAGATGATGTAGGAGGAGSSSSITGTALTRAGGGGGGLEGSGSGGSGGSGGGGAGGSGNTNPVAGTANTGSGGGGHGQNAAGGSGGSGIVIVRYAA